MTIDLLRVNLDGCFAPGQAYVACSRGRSAETMVVESFSERGIITSDLVKDFYSALKSGISFEPPTWIAALENAKNEPAIKKKLTEQYCQDKCRRCSGPCSVRKIRTPGANQGKWVLQCDKNYNMFREIGRSEKDHTYRYVPAPQTI